jgi:hypothetical protein
VQVLPHNDTRPYLPDILILCPDFIYSLEIVDTVDFKAFRSLLKPFMASAKILSDAATVVSSKADGDRLPVFWATRTNLPPCPEFEGTDKFPVESLDTNDVMV